MSCKDATVIQSVWLGLPTYLCGQCPLLASLVGGPNTNPIRVSALSVQRFLQYYQPGHRIDGEETIHRIHQGIHHSAVQTWAAQETNSQRHKSH